jgi:hypothetical protein
LFFADHAAAHFPVSLGAFPHLSVCSVKDPSDVASGICFLGRPGVSKGRGSRGMERGSGIFPAGVGSAGRTPSMTCPDMSSLAVVVEKVPTPCAGGGAVGRVVCAGGLAVRRVCGDATLALRERYCRAPGFTRTTLG